MIKDQAPTAAIQMDPAYVAPMLPPTAPAPETARHVHFTTGLLGFWLLPGRFGPHLAVMSFWRAWAAFILSIVIAGVAALTAYACQFAPGGMGLQEIRIGMAIIIIETAAASASSWWLHPLIILGGSLLMLQIPPLLLAIILMPWCAGGDRAWSVFKRSLKNVYWSTTLLIPFSLVGAALAITYKTWSPWLHQDKPLILAVLLVLTIVIIVTLRALINGASRYVGEPEGPAFYPREPLCDECGYRIIGLPLVTNCPECGTSVLDSLPGGRRQPTAWQKRFGLSRVGALIQMQWHILRDRDFFKHIPVHSGLTAARSFCFATILLILLVNLGLLKAWSMLWLRDDGIEPILWAWLMMVGIGLLAQPFMMFIGCLWAQFGYEIRDYRISAIVCHYSSVLMWPLMITVLLSCAFELTPVAKNELFVVHHIPFTNHGCYIPLVVFIWAGFTLAAIIFWFMRLFAALRAVRFANV